MVQSFGSSRLRSQLLWWSVISYKAKCKRTPHAGHCNVCFPECPSPWWRKISGERPHTMDDGTSLDFSPTFPCAPSLGVNIRFSKILRLARFNDKSTRWLMWELELMDGDLHRQILKTFWCRTWLKAWRNIFEGSWTGFGVLYTTDTQPRKSHGPHWTKLNGQ